MRRWEKFNLDTRGPQLSPTGKRLGRCPHGSGGPRWGRGGRLSILEELSGLDVPRCHHVHPVPPMLALPGPVPAPTGSTWPCWTCPRTSHLLLDLLGPSWSPSSPPGPSRPTLALITSSSFSWTCFGALHLLQILPNLSWWPQTPPGPTLAPTSSSWSCKTHPGQLCLTLLHPAWCPPSSPTSLAPIRVSILFSRSSRSHHGLHHLLQDPSWCPPWSPTSPASILVSIIFSRSSRAHPGVHHCLLLLLHPS